ncbi:MAG: ATP-binding protein [Candidatus Aminicenantes bacterium]
MEENLFTDLAMEDLSLHILDIVENSVAAKADKVEITISENKKMDLLSIEISDNGIGMDQPITNKVFDPFFSTKTTRRFGLGLPLLLESAKAANGNLSLKSKKGQGTKIEAKFQHSHIDRKPLGDIGQTLITLVMGNPEIEFIYIHKKNGCKCRLDTRKIKSQLKDKPINSLEGIKILKKDINKIQKKLKEVKNER